MNKRAYHKTKSDKYENEGEKLLGCTKEVTW